MRRMRKEREGFQKNVDAINYPLLEFLGMPRLID
jgi:hypothetical protein